MLAKKDDAINDLVVTYKKLTDEEIERWIAFAEEDRIRTENGLRYEIQKRDEAIKERDNAIQEQANAIQEQANTIQLLKQQLAELQKN